VRLTSYGTVHPTIVNRDFVGKLVGLHESYGDGRQEDANEFCSRLLERVRTGGTCGKTEGRDEVVEQLVVAPEENVMS
jgi:ubiquitin C-terminal hydrolase